ncbi:MAG: polyprenyl synthetase family protein [Pseudomonadales bacterium]|nr:polyprenyl synthetase family protein [Pseudomonadales bacterium]
MTDLFRPFIDRVDQQLANHLRLPGIPPQLQQAMYYGVFNGGKRIRPLLVYLTSLAFDNSLSLTDNTAAAFELVHAYSLIHDDLPAMDDDELRRGKPTLHIKYDEATAILAGDALQALAFELIATDPLLGADCRIKLIKLITRAIGAQGMIAGQVLDLAAEKTPINASQLEHMHQRKTGDLITASILAGAFIAEADQQSVDNLTSFGQAIGLAFQVKDDILDATGDTAIMGKSQGADLSRNKTTFISLHGLDTAKECLEKLHKQAVVALQPFGSKAALLLSLNDFVFNRNH